MTGRPDLGWLLAALLLPQAGCGRAERTWDECQVDTDCPDDRACRTKWNNSAKDRAYKACVPAACRADEDCAAPHTCVTVDHWDGCFWNIVVRCTSDDDRCATDDDCVDGPTTPTGASAHTGIAAECLPVGDTGIAPAATQQCVVRGAFCTIGRPLSVPGGERVAPIVLRTDWALPSAVVVPGPDVAAVLAAHWSDLARLEHASVGSFARFTLELLGLGAPPDLLADVQRATLDELEHTKLAFGLVARFGGRDQGPGPLALDGVLPATDPADVFAALVEEACVGETLGAALARAQAREARDPALAAILDRIADDEATHAALAWRCLSWLLERYPALRPELAGRVADASERLAAGLAAGPPGLRGWGILEPAHAARVARAVHQQVLAPLLTHAGGCTAG